MAGQVAYHLMDQDRITRAPWAITTLVSCLPVLVLGMGTALAHMLREDAAAAVHERTDYLGPAARVQPTWSLKEQSGNQPKQDPPDRTAAEDRPPGQAVTVPLRDGHGRAERPAPAPCCRAGHRSRPRHCPRACRSAAALLPAGSAQPRGQRLERGT
jgi:hypothetical protein